ncbi:MAG: hypothetical protein J6K72_10150 [Clostridia bacterium]|nr:hypothetical protein [Clostridia bacterium]
MKCPTCFAEWNVGSESKEWVNCPFCGSIMPTVQIDSLEKALQRIVDVFGMETLKNGDRLLGILKDIAPELRKEHNLLFLFVEGNDLPRLFNAKSIKRNEQEELYRKTVAKLVDKWFIQTAAAEYVTSCYFEAIGINIQSLKANLQNKNTADTPLLQTSSQHHWAELTNKQEYTDNHTVQMQSAGQPFGIYPVLSNSQNGIFVPSPNSVVQNATVMNPATGRCEEQRLTWTYNPFTRQYVVVKAEPIPPIKSQLPLQNKPILDPIPTSNSVLQTPTTCASTNQNTMRDISNHQGSSILDHAKDSAISKATRSVTEELIKKLVDTLKTK